MLAVGSGEEASHRAAEARRTIQGRALVGRAGARRLIETAGVTGRTGEALPCEFRRPERGRALQRPRRRVGVAALVRVASTSSS